MNKRILSTMLAMSLIAASGVPQYAWAEENVDAVSESESTVEELQPENIDENIAEAYLSEEIYGNNQADEDALVVGESENTLNIQDEGDCRVLTSDVLSDPVEAFVSRLYKNILGRDADASGLKAWSDVLKSGKEQGAKVAQGFVDSQEMKNRNLSDDDYIKALYQTFLNREADAAGLAAWKNVLDSGLSRMHVFKGFAESQEFTEICEKYGIIRGNTQLTAPCDQNEGVTKFIVRNYRLYLGRNADEDGLNGWCNAILTGQNTAKQAAHGFVFSDEFKKKNLSDTEYVKTLYRVFMDREADGAGLEAWVKVLRNGQSREHVFNGFADSDEFKKICISYGLKVENDKSSQNTNTQPSQGSGTYSPNYTITSDNGRQDNYYIDLNSGYMEDTNTGEATNIYDNSFFDTYQGK